MKRALLVIDVQNEYFTGRMPVSYPEGSFGRILSVIDAANSRGIPVILVQHSSVTPGAQTFAKGGEAWEIHPEVLSKPNDGIVEKLYPGSFTGTNLDGMLRHLGVDTVTISGYMTQMCCDTTARQAFHLGYKVEFLSDATGTLDITGKAGFVRAEDLHKAVLVTQSSVFSDVVTSGEWIERVGR